MVPFSFKAKHAVIIGYLLVITIMIIGIFSVYRNLVDFSDKKIRDEDLSELLIVGSTISKLYEIESSQNLFNVQSAERYFAKYDSILPQVHQQIDSLRHLSKDSSRISKLDSIETLLDLKNKNLKEIVVLLDSIAKAPRITRETVSSYVPRSLNNEITDYLQSHNINAVTDTVKADTMVVYAEKRGFFDRVKDVFVARTDSTSTVTLEKKTTLSVEQFKSVIDTVVNMVRYSERLDLENQKRFQYILLERQNMMSQTNSELTGQINALLKGIESEELEKSVQLLRDRDDAISKSQNTVHLVSWLAIVIALVFGILFFADINRSQRYRRQLEISNKRISELLKSREQLMFAVIHDIKAPMSSVLGYIELMQTELTPQQKQLYLSNMKNSSEHVLQLAANLLDFHKLESGTMVLKEMNVNIYDLVENTADSFRPIAHQKKLKYLVDNKIDENVVGFSDPYVIRQIMSNIISNAIKYTFDGTVSVTARQELKNNQPWFVFSVKDTGVGIDKSEQHVVFDEFKQLNSDALLVEGSGLGLTITKRLIDKLNGTISLNSEKGKGSEFIVKLPLKAEQKVRTKTHSLPDFKDYNIEKISVLLVDDDPVQLKMTSEMLLLKKAEVQTENNPMNVVDMLFGHQYDIIFIDIQMPQMNGFELVRKIRTLNNYKQTPIIALSAKSDISKADVNAAEFTNFLTKPFTSEELYATVCNYVKCTEVSKEVVVDNELKSEGVKVLISFVQEDKVASVEILDAFIQDTSANLSQLDEAFNKKDDETAAQLAHKMLPLIQMINDSEVVSFLRQLEKGEQVTSQNKKEILARIQSYVEEAKVLRDKISRS